MGKKLGPFGHTIHEVGIRVRLPIDVGELRQKIRTERREERYGVQLMY